MHEATEVAEISEASCSIERTVVEQPPKKKQRDWVHFLNHCLKKRLQIHKNQWF